MQPPIFAVGLVLVLTMACTSHIVDENILPADATTPLTRAATLTPLQNIQSADLAIPPITPEIDKICPTQQDVSLDKIGLSSQDRLIVVPYDDPLYYSKNGLFTVNATGPTVHPIDGTSPKDGELNVFSGLEVSPNGKWVMYQQGSQQEEQLKLWISSVDAKQQWEIAPIDKGDMANWVSDQEIVVVSSGNSEPLISIFPFLHKAENLSPLPTDTESLKYLTLGTNLYDIYFGGSFDNSTRKFIPKFVLHDYSTESDLEIFPWMASDEYTGGIPGENIIHFLWDFWVSKDDSFVVVAQKPYGFDVADNLNLANGNEEQAYSKVMKPIILPAGSPDIGIIWPFQSVSAFAFERYDRAKLEPQLRQFFVFDFQQMILKDYCLDRGHTELWGSYASPDERFLAWTVYQLDGGYVNAKEVVVLNLASGQVSRIPDVKLRGWGIVEP